MADPATETLFNQEQTLAPVPSTEEVKPQVTVDPNAPFADLLKSVTTEDGRQKYSDVNSALAALPHTQKHISSIEKENADLREELTKRKAAEEALQTFKESHETTTATPVEVDYSKVADYVRQTITEQEIQNTETQNITDVVLSMKEKYSDKAEEVFYAKAQEVGLSAKQINDLAKQSPSAALKLIGEASPQPMSHMQSSVNTETLPDAADTTSAKVPEFATTKDLTNAWRNAGKTVQNRESN